MRPHALEQVFHGITRLHAPTTFHRHVGGARDDRGASEARKDARHFEGRLAQVAEIASVAVSESAWTDGDTRIPGGAPSCASCRVSPVTAFAAARAAIGAPAARTRLPRRPS